MAYQSFQLTDILAQLSARYESVPFWTETEATNAINESLLFWNLLTGFWRAPVTLITTINNFDYQLPASLVFGTRVEFLDTIDTETFRHTLAETSLHEMDSAHPGWQGQTTEDGGSIPDRPHVWFPISIDLIAIWPADGVGGNSLVVDGVSATPELVDPTDYIDIGNEELGALLGFSLHILALKEGGQRFAATQPYFQEFLRAAAEENDQLMQSSLFRHFTGTDLRRQELPTRGNATSYDRLGNRTP